MWPTFAHDPTDRSPGPRGRGRRRLAVTAAVSVAVTVLGAVPASALTTDLAVAVEPVPGDEVAGSYDMKLVEDEVVLHQGLSLGADPAPCTAFSVDETTTLDEVSAAIGADRARARGIDGRGIDIAVVDTGVQEVGGLVGRTVEGVDLSFDHRNDNLRGADLHGHGTAMASIAASHGGFGGDGVASGARVVDVKVGAANGAVDVSQVIAAIDWVVTNKDTDGRNIRVLNLSYNTDSLQSYEVDPLARAVENAWHAGIVVVVAGGNDGRAVGRLGNPATDPFVIAVGAAEAKGERWQVAKWSSVGDGRRNPDVVAPGQAILAGGVLGSQLASNNPGAVCVGDASAHLRGSGTSQAAAVVSGSAALLLQQRPGLTPDQVKHLLVTTARGLGGNVRQQGAGMIDVAAALGTQASAQAVQTHRRSTGMGSLELARGTMHVGTAPDQLTGEQTAFGTPWDPAAWVRASSAGQAWTVETDGSGWSGATWSGATWSGATWSGATWSGATWSGATWSGATWSGATWSGATWSGATWSGATWSGATWSGATWSGLGWTGASWTGSSWTGASWT